MLIGFETFNRESLQDYRKGINRNNLSRYKELVDGFHKAGISVFGGFIIGADQDNENTVAETALEAVRLGIDTIQITNLTHFPALSCTSDFWMRAALPAPALDFSLLYSLAGKASVRLNGRCTPRR
jgi:radical SAM superfamily enzyme YgiQ (UPF0313 family)